MMDIRTIVIDNDKIYICCEEVHIQYSYRNQYCISTLVYIKLCDFRKQKYTNIYIYIYNIYSVHLESLAEGIRETVSLPRLGALSIRFCFCQELLSRDCTRFTLHDLTDFYVERVTAHCIKINDHSCFQNRLPNSKTN